MKRAKKLDRNDPNWPAKLTAETFDDQDKKYRYRLFGMAGTWSEYWYFDHYKKPLLEKAKRILRAGYDCHLEDTKTGKVWTIRLVTKEKKLWTYRPTSIN